MKSIKVSAPGKIHLLGEHAVVYGKPALLAAVDKRVFVEITPRKDNKKEIIVTQSNGQRIIDYINHAIAITMQYYKRPRTKGFSMTITSEIPTGAGMGSSAASAVAIAGAVTLFLKEKFDKEKINDIAFEIEKYNHANPSGGDNSASCYGGFIWYRKETENIKIIKSLALSLAKEIKKNFYIFNTGMPQESTGEMVSLVSTFVKKNKRVAGKIFTDQEDLTRNFFSALLNGDEKGIIKNIKLGEKNLEKIGVVSARVKKIIRDIEKTGGAAKICGGGGKKKATGVLLIYHKNRKKSPYAMIQLGSEGIRRESFDSAQDKKYEK